MEALPIIAPLHKSPSQVHVSVSIPVVFSVVVVHFISLSFTHPYSVVAAAAVPDASVTRLHALVSPEHFFSAHEALSTACPFAEQLS